MDQKLLQKLTAWRDIVAQHEGVPPWRVLPNKTLENIAGTGPRTKEELLQVKGIKERKFARYGKEMLTIINKKSDQVPEDNRPYSVSKYLALINENLREQKARVRGEICEWDKRDNYFFFSLKDKEDESILRCFMWGRDYELCGISFEEGIEIIIEGYSEVYKPSGRFTFRVFTAELVGEGAFKKAYQELMRRLEKEGVFASEIKKPVPEFSQKIGLVTSATGAVIHDFLNNLGQYGYHIKFVSSRVEGQVAVRDLLSAVNYLAGQDIDILVIIRGGGSLESLQAFNNEKLVRKITRVKVPVICGIGHEKDVPLVSLAADLMVSTPTAAAVAINKSWEQALSDIQIMEFEIINKYQKVLVDEKYKLDILARRLARRFDAIFQKLVSIIQKLNNELMTLSHKLKDAKKNISYLFGRLLAGWRNGFVQVTGSIKEAEKRMKAADPKRQLKLGYSIVSAGDKIVKSVKQVREGDEIDVRVSDGKMKSKIKNIISRQKN